VLDLATKKYKVPKRALDIAYFSSTDFEFVEVFDESDYSEALKQPLIEEIVLLVTLPG
jgi:hypothetical protein